MKKLLSIILSVVLLFSCIPIGVLATETADTTATLTVDSTYASVGGTVDVDVVIANNPGVAGATLSIAYDENLTLISADSGEAFSVLDFSGNEVESFSNPSKFSWDSENSVATQNGVILRLNFSVSENAEFNSKLDINVSYRDGDVYNEENDLTLEIVNGYVTVIDYIPGDLYEDGIINTKDVRLIRQLINGNLSMDVNEAAADVNDDGVVNTKDTRLLRRYINGGYGVELKPSTPRCEHSLTATLAKEAECTVDGNIAYWYCSKCEKHFSDAEGSTEISLSDTVIEATGHTYADTWSSDEVYHWHGASCEHSEEETDKAVHNFNGGTICTICNYNSVVITQLAAPIITDISYDTIYWDSVPNAIEYLVTVNADYEYVTKNTQCKLNQVKCDGDTISDHGLVNVTVQAIGHDNFTDSQKASYNEEYYYVPETNLDTATLLKSYSIGQGYNLVNDDYLDITRASTKEVFNVAKLLTIGQYSKINHSAQKGTAYNYSSIDEFISNTKTGFEYKSEVGCSLIGSLKMQINAELGVDYRQYAYNETYVYEYTVTYKDYSIKNFSDDNLLQYCLSDTFAKDVRRESSATNGMDDARLIEYLFNTYGTHAILGITTGGKFNAQYVISTNSQDVATKVKAEFSTGASLDLGAFASGNTESKINFENSTSYNSEESVGRFTVNAYGGSGAGATKADDVTAAISRWSDSFNEDTAVSMAFTKDGAIAISNLIGYLDTGLSIEFENYIAERTDELYSELYGMFTKPTNLPMQVVNEGGKNILKIDISDYQDVGSLSNVYSPYMINNVLTIYPTMLGKQIDAIHLLGDFDYANPTALIDSFAICLDSSWNKTVDLTIENLGVISASESGFVSAEALQNHTMNIKFIGNNRIDGNFVGLDNITDITFQGDTEAVYTKLNMSAGNSNLTMNLNNFKFEGNITALEEKFIDLTINCTGTNQINGSMIGFDDVTITGNGDLAIYGADGANGIDGIDGSVSGESGTDGTDGADGQSAMIVDSLTINMSDSSTLILKGGNGGNGGRGGHGYDGKDGDDGVARDYKKGTDGQDGDNGGNGGNGGSGGNGGVALVCNILTVTDGELLAYGGNAGNAGNGGNGGNGGDGGNGGSWSDGRLVASWDDQHTGFNAGDGGNAGVAGNAGNAGELAVGYTGVLTGAVTNINGEEATVIAHNGDHGEYGLGGTGGKHSHSGWNPVYGSNGDDGKITIAL